MEPIDLVGLAAHPDDVELSCAGTMVLAKKQGKRTAIIDLTRGELSTRGTLETRAAETKEATRVMGLDERINLGMPDGNIELSQSNLMQVIQALRTMRPTVLLTPHKHERHPDHEAASELAHRANFYSGLAKIETHDAEGNPQKPHRPLLVLQYMQTYTFDPKIILDVSSVFEARMAAVNAYGSQFSRPLFQTSKKGLEPGTGKHRDDGPVTFLSQSGFYEWIEARARHYGMLIGAEYGEPFWSYEVLGVRDLFGLVTKRVS